MPPRHLSKEEALTKTSVGDWTYFSDSQPEISKAKKLPATFSVGIFKVGLNGKQEKMALPAVMRLTGKTDDPEELYNRANYAWGRFQKTNPRTETEIADLVERVERELLHL